VVIAARRVQRTWLDTCDQKLIPAHGTLSDHADLFKAAAKTGLSANVAGEAAIEAARGRDLLGEILDS
jgi:hypothetical protein